MNKLEARLFAVIWTLVIALAVWAVYSRWTVLAEREALVVEKISSHRECH